ncbi:cysteine desulfurase family protein [Mycobacteroides abscessus]|uniref:cysteine desulfurase family protein n=1 Tax=Mycobacteroides abscessus TaxID=36809 RepID=UPI0019CFC5ED|nr:cysteine desulfurase family protein [Mycobacteroides abscessus]
MVGVQGKTIYCDHNATTPMRRVAVEAMIRWLEQPANASSRHIWGQQAAAAVEEAREQVALIIGARAREIVFTSGATEANNLAIHAALSVRPRVMLVTTAVEHAAVLQVARARNGSAVVGVDHNGRVDLAALSDALRKYPGAVVSVIAANNETGVITDLPAVSTVVRRAGGLMHTDATQAVGRIPVDVDHWDVDLLSLSGHKFGGPAGAGALYVRREAPLPVRPMFHGGEQERGWRPGTVNVASVVALGAAAEEAKSLMHAESGYVQAIRDQFESEVRHSGLRVRCNGEDAARLPGVSSLTLAGCPADAVMAAMPHIAVSEGSACSSGALEPSHVLLAMGRSPEEADSTLRFSFGYTNAESDGPDAARSLVAAVSAVDRAVGFSASAAGPVVERQGVLA